MFSNMIMYKLNIHTNKTSAETNLIFGKKV